VIGNTIKDVWNFTVLLAVFCFTFSLFGMELFAEKMKFNSENRPDIENGASPRLNFDNFFNSFTEVFLLLQGENWQW